MSKPASWTGKAARRAIRSNGRGTWSSRVPPYDRLCRAPRGRIPDSAREVFRAAAAAMRCVVVPCSGGLLLRAHRAHQLKVVVVRVRERRDRRARWCALQLIRLADDDRAGGLEALELASDVWCLDVPD